MAIKLSPDITDNTFKTDATARQRYHHAETINAETGLWVILSAGVEEIMVSVAPVSGTARVQYTQASAAQAPSLAELGIAATYPLIAPALGRTL